MYWMWALCYPLPYGAEKAAFGHTTNSIADRIKRMSDSGTCHENNH